MKYKLVIISVMCIMPCLAVGAAEVDIGGSLPTDTSGYKIENYDCGFPTKGDFDDILDSLDKCYKYASEKDSDFGNSGSLEHIKDNQWKETVDESKTVRIWTLTKLSCDEGELVNGLCQETKPDKPAVTQRKPAPAKKAAAPAKKADEKKKQEELAASRDFIKACNDIGGKLSADKKTCNFTYTAKAGTTKEEQTEAIDKAKDSFVDEETYKCNDDEGTSKRTLTCQDKYKNTVNMVFEFPTDAEETEEDWKEDFKKFCEEEGEDYDKGSKLSDNGTHCTFSTSKTIDQSDVVLMLHNLSTSLNKMAEEEGEDGECGTVKYTATNTYSIKCTADDDIEFTLSLNADNFSCLENDVFNSNNGKCEKDDTADSGDDDDDAGTDSVKSSSSCAEQVSADVECSIPGIAKPGCKIQKIPEDDEELIADMYGDYFDKDEDSALSKTKEYVISTYCYDDNDNFVASIEEDDDDDTIVVPETTDKEELKKALKKQARSIVNKHNKKFDVLNTKQS